MKSNKKHQIKNMKLHEISLVDNPANQHAHVTLFKSQDAIKDALVDICEKSYEEPKDKFFDALSDRLMQDRKYEINDKLWPLFEALRESIETSAQEISDDGRKSKIRQNVEDFVMSIEDAMKSDNPASPSGATDDLEVTMDVKELTKKLSDLEGQVTELTKAKEDAETKVAALTKSIEDAGYTVEGEACTIAKSEDAYVEIEGEQVLKSSVPAPMLKMLETQAEKIAKMEAAQEAVELSKRADDEIPHLSGSSMAKGALLKAVDALSDEHKDEITKALKAADIAVSKNFEEIGKSDGDVDMDSATAQLEKMANDYASDKGVSYETAYAEVTKSGEGRKLLAKSYAEGSN